MQLINPEKLKILPSLHLTIIESCRKQPHKIAMLGKAGTSRQYTYGELAGYILKLAGGLRSLGLKAGDRVGILSENCPEWGLTYLAILNAGGIVVPFDSAWKEMELRNILKMSGIRFIFCSGKYAGVAREIINQSALDTQLIGFEPDNAPNLEILAKAVPLIGELRSMEDPAALIYTSGTTGDPKGVILTHRNILSNIEAIIHCIEFYSDDIYLSVLPLHHTLEATCGFLLPLCIGTTIAYSKSLKSRDILEDIRNHGVTCMVGVPLLFEKMYKTIEKRIEESPFARRLTYRLLYGVSRLAWNFKIRAGKSLFRKLRNNAGLGSIRLLISGGAPLPAEIAEWFNLVGFDFLQGYGMTECSPVVSVHRPHDIRFESVGSPLPALSVEIDNPSPEGIGEIKVKGPSNTPGYLDNAKATAELIRDGWLYTGDMGRLSNGHLYITGRKKNLIVSAAGKNIYPEEIENALLMSPYILESVVLGRKKDNKMGEEIFAAIVPDLERIKSHEKVQGQEPGPEQIQQIIDAEVTAVNDRLADYKRINRFEVRYQEFEKTSSRKIKRSLYR
ncbi:MAG: AMP-dependent synthetase/ligase [candidate division Zixibacteria bacterium]|nr:AMP-dependent synthetase/ligase [candidate division Zixibacteria bacterium]